MRASSAGASTLARCPASSSTWARLLRVGYPSSGTTFEAASSFVAGLSDTYVTTESLGDTAGIEIGFTPLGAYVFLGVPTHEFGERLYGLSEVLGREADFLTEKIDSLQDWQERFDVLDEYIARRFAGARLPSPQVEAAYGTIVRSNGQRRIASLADAAGWSEKHLVARFREQVGLAPKAMAQVIRFNRALQLLQAAEGQSLADVVFEAGYYDQPHMNRDFRRFTGGSPSDFLHRSLPDGAGLRDA
jgi:AraC-like DNA-binding protein